MARGNLTRAPFETIRALTSLVRPSRGRRVITIVVIVTAQLLSLIGGAPDVAAQAASSSSRKVVVDAADRETAATLTARGGRILVDYGSFALWTVPQADLPSIQSRPGATVRDDLDTIRLRGGATIDGRAGTSGAQTPPAGLHQARTSGQQFWLVQFVGPIKEQWPDELRAVGLELVMYMPQNAYVVWGDGAALTKLDELARQSPVIQFTGPYHPSYRLSPALQRAQPANATGGSVPVTVQFYATRDVSQSVARLRALGGQIHDQASTVRTLTSISLDLPVGQLTAVASWPDVFNVEPYDAPKMHDEAQGQVVAGNIGIGQSGYLEPITGSGVYLAWLTSKGFPTTPESYPIVDVVDDGIDNGNTTPAHPDFYERGTVVNADRLVYLHNCTTDPKANSGGGHGTINASIAGGYNNLSGPAYQDVFDLRLGLGISPYGRLAGTKVFTNAGGLFNLSACGNTVVDLVQASFDSGATITSNSWGASVYGDYNARAQQYDALTRDASKTSVGNQQMLHVFSAGNDGRLGAETIGSPATAKNVLAVGASESYRNWGRPDGCGELGYPMANAMTTFSSRGPTQDGRAKPDIVAPGSHIQGAASQDPELDGSGVCGAVGNLRTPHEPGTQYYPPNQTLYTWSSGTSHAAPAVAGAASLVANYYGRVLKPGQTPSPAMLKALLLSTPRYLDGDRAGGTLPSPRQGWGSVNLGPLFDGSPRFIVDQERLFTATGQTYTRTGTVASTATPFRVTLVWTDAPGSTTGDAFVNDLDLEVTIGGKTFKGNVFNGDTSTTGGDFDNRDNVEHVFLPAGVSGPFTVRVIARNLAGDGVPGNASLLDQDFALVISNADVPPMAILDHVAVTTSDAEGNNNGAVDLAESVSLQVGVQNDGDATATTVRGSLAVIGGNATLINANTIYPDIAPRGTGANGKPYVFQVAPTQPCGSDVTFRHTVSFSGVQSDSRDFPIRVGKLVTASTSRTSPDVPKPMTDASTGITIDLPITGISGQVLDVNVRASVTHSFLGSVALDLVSPGGTVVSLIHGRGYSAGELADTVFDDQAAAEIANGIPPFTGSFRPEQPLSAVHGEPASGTWRLRARNILPVGEGSVTGFALEITAGTYVCAFMNEPDLSTNVAHTGSFVAGQNGTYTLTVANGAASGPTRGPITVTDTLPAGLSFVSGTGGGWTCGAASQVVTCTNPGPLPTGGSSAITVVVGVSPAASPGVTNTACVKTLDDVATNNDCHSDPTVVTLPPVQPVPSPGPASLGLTVAKAGAGSGVVTSADAQVNCGSICSVSYPAGTSVTLMATPAAGSTFDGWSGACTGNDSCQVTVDTAKSVTATFTPRSGAQTVALTIARAGTGAGAVTSQPAGITCGADCSASYGLGAQVTLTAAPSARSTFVGWSGPCTGTGACQVTMDAARTVTATFHAEAVGVGVGHGPGPSGSSDATLTATLSARPRCGAIDRIEFGEPGRPFDNARVSIVSPTGGQQTQTSGFTYKPPAGTTSVSLTIQRVVPSGGATVTPIHFFDGCGDWQTFVGGGSEAFR